MKKIRSRCLAVLLGTVISSGSFAFAADSAKEKKDPFTRDAAKGDEPGQVDEGVDNIVLGFQLIEVPQKEVFKWEQEGLNWGVWYEKVNELIDTGEAGVLISTAQLVKSGQRALVTSHLRLPYPTESKVLDMDPNGPPFPTAFEIRKLGLILMVDPVLSFGRKELDLNYSLEWSGYAGENLETRPTSDRIEATDIVAPKFRTSKISNSADFVTGEYQMLTQFEGGEKNSVVLVFARFDLVTAAPLEDKTKLSETDGVKIRSYWVDLPADLWHEWLRKNSLATLFGGEAWKKVSQQIQAENDVKILASPTLLSRSGQRSKVEVVDERKNPTAFLHPKVQGGAAEVSEQEDESIGMTLETDPVLGVSGIIDLSLAATYSSVCGSAVSYRHEEKGKWVPSIAQLRIFEDYITTQVSLDEGMKLLTAVMTPSKEDGSLDYSRKLLFFISNETFQSP